MDYIPSYSDSIRFDIRPFYTDSLTHHGIKGMKWGVRNYQKADGSLTLLGKYRYARNSRYINAKRRTATEYAERNEKLARAYRKSAADIRKTGAQESMRAGFDKKTSEKAARVLSAQRERYAQMGEEIAKNLRCYDTKLSQINPAAQSHKETKKMVDKLIRESAENIGASMVSYTNSTQFQTYRNSGGQDRTLVSSGNKSIRAK